MSDRFTVEASTRSNHKEFPWLVRDVSTDEPQALCSNKETAETLARQLNKTWAATA
jgi:hypothetical protein